MRKTVSSYYRSPCSMASHHSNVTDYRAVSDLVQVPRPTEPPTSSTHADRRSRYILQSPSHAADGRSYLHQ